MVEQSNKYNILVSDQLEEAGLGILRSENHVLFKPAILPEELTTILPEFQALIVRSRTDVSADVINAGTSLKVIGRAGVGINNIDIKTALHKKIIVVNSPLSPTRAVAELTFGMMIALARKIPQADASLKQQKWEKGKFLGTELNGKTLGLIGLGHIGTEVARLATAFDMNILAYDPYLKSEQIRQRHAQPTNLDQLLENSDFISFHLPITDSTRGLIGTPQLDSMKKGVFLICTARGGIINEDALKNSLDSDQIAGAALDVFTTEPPPPNSIAIHPKVVATPHIGAMTKEALTKASVSIAEEVNNALSGKPLRWQISKSE